MRTRFHAAVLTLAALYLSSSVVDAQTAPPAAFHFQGRLATPAGNPVADGTHSVTFAFYDAASGGTVLYAKTLAAVQVKNGTFAVVIDGFTFDKFNGNAWIGIKIGDAAELAPRTQIVSVPYALKSNLAMTVPDASIGTAKISDGAINFSKINASDFETHFWRTGGNSAVGSNYLGTNDDNPLDIRTNGTTRMWITGAGLVGIGTNNPTANLHLKSIGNTSTVIRIESGVNNGFFSAIDFADRGTNIWGMGKNTTNDFYIDRAAVGRAFTVKQDTLNIGIGTNFPASKLDVIGTITMTGIKMTTGAAANRVLTSDASGTGTWAQIGTANIADGTITADKFAAGLFNTTAWLLGGNSGVTNGFIGTTDANPLEFRVNSVRALRLSRTSNSSYVSVNTLGGSEINTVGGGTVGVTIAGGGAKGLNSTLDQPNASTASYTTIGGGVGNSVTAQYATVSGGGGNVGGGQFAAVGGGVSNHADGDYTSIGGGFVNSATGSFASVAGGAQNTASGLYAMVAGGSFNTALGVGSFAAGSNAKASHLGAFVWSDFTSSGTEFASTGIDQFVVRASGGVGINTNNPAGFALNVNGTAKFSGNITVVSTTYTSDARFKKNVVDLNNPLDALLNLHGVAYEWDREKFADQHFASGKQLGFLAQEVEAIFPELIVTDAKGYKSVNYVGMIPVAVEAIKAQQKQIELLKKISDAAQKENAELRARLERIEAFLERQR